MENYNIKHNHVNRPTVNLHYYNIENIVMFIVAIYKSKKKKTLNYAHCLISLLKKKKKYESIASKHLLAAGWIYLV